MSAWAGAANDSGSATFYVAPALTQLHSGAVPEEATDEASLIAARGEREAFFVVLRGGAAASGRLRVRWSPLRSPRGMIGSTQLRVYRALWADAGGKRVADALVPIDAHVEVIGASVEPGEDLPLYVEVTVPRTATPGAYTGRLEIESDGGRAQVPIHLQVSAARLPLRASLPTAFEFSSREAALGAGEPLDANDLRRLVSNYALLALADRVTLIGGTGQAPAFHVIRGENALRVDYRNFDAEVATLMNGVPALGGAAQSAITLRLPDGIRGLERFRYVMAFEQHLREKGWADRLIAFSDHPALMDVVVPDAILAHRVHECAFADCARGKVGENRWWTLRPARESSALRLGASAAQVRAIAWLAFAGGAQGLRYTGVVSGFGEARSKGTAPVDALFYPVTPGKGGEVRVVESLRLKALRDGLEDYELLKLAREAGRGGVAGEWVTRIAPAPDRVSAAPVVWRKAREALHGAVGDAVAAKTSGPADPVPADRACAGKGDGSTTVCP
ncbi:MAG: DUF4091 domain-containing protein [Myxococcaceae bacterium]|nr:DUF4091 domain-containing protein [Myxococcaceae bacterium]